VTGSSSESPLARDSTVRAQPDSPSLDRDKVIEADTDLGSLWLQKGSEVLTGPILEYGYWEPTITPLLRKTLKPGMTFVDCGANIGYFSVLAARLVGPEGRVLAIEPDPGNVRILEANLSRHGCQNATVLPMAAWSERSQLNLIRHPTDGAVTKVGAGAGVGGAGSVVSAAPLDELIQGRVDFLKVDCELTDHVVIGGARRLISENPSILITAEFCPWEDSHTGDSPRQMLRVYDEVGLAPYEIVDMKGTVVPTTYEALADISELPDDDICLNIAMSPTEPRHLVGKRPKSWLEKAGDLLGYVPAALRPPIRRRDRKAREERQANREA
jgi:FkbM family methyltransferase